MDTLWFFVILQYATYRWFLQEMEMHVPEWCNPIDTGPQKSVKNTGRLAPNMCYFLVALLDPKKWLSAMVFWFCNHWKFEGHDGHASWRMSVALLHLCCFPDQQIVSIDIQVLRFSVFGLWSSVHLPCLFRPALPSHCLLQQQQQRCLSRVGMCHENLN